VTLHWRLQEHVRGMYVGRTWDVTWTDYSECVGGNGRHTPPITQKAWAAK